MYFIVALYSSTFFSLIKRHYSSALNVAAIILGCILSMLFSVFNAFGPRSIPTPPTDALIEFFHADTVTSIHPLPVSWYLISSVCVYRCSCMQIMSILCSTADAVSSDSWPILFRVLTLNVAICIVCLHFSSFCLSLIIWKSDLTDKMKRSFFQAAVVSILLYGCTTWTLTKRLERKLDGNYTRMLKAVLNKSWRQHPTRLQLYGHLPPITKTIQVRRTRHAGHCWRSKDELISNVLLWTPTYGCAKVGRPARTYIQQLCEDTGCNPEDLPEAMNDRKKWRERVRDIRAGGATWWWWWFISILPMYILRWSSPNHLLYPTLSGLTKNIL